MDNVTFLILLIFTALFFFIAGNICGRREGVKQAENQFMDKFLNNKRHPEV